MTNKKQAFNLFEELIKEAEKELFDFTLNQPFGTTSKADKTLVTNCDSHIDERLSAIAKENGFNVISEEGEQEQDIVKTGDYLTIDPIDGTLGYIDYIKNALENGGIENFTKKDLGPASDFCLLLGIVEKKIPRFGACYNFVTKEKIFIDSESKDNFIRLNNSRNYKGKNAVYVDQRKGGKYEDELVAMPDVTVIKQATLGLKSLYTIVNPHQSAITVHQVQNAGLWDIMPAAAAARAFGGEVLDANGSILELDKYIILPGVGAVVIKGDYFQSILREIKSRQ